MLGLLYARQGRWAEAAEAYRHAVSLAPDSARYHNNLGNYYVRTGDLDAGIGAYQQSLTVDPQYSKAAYNLGVALVRAQRFEAAEAALERALAGDRESTDTYYHLGLLRARRVSCGARCGAPRARRLTSTYTRASLLRTPWRSVGSSTSSAPAREQAPAS